MVIQGARGICLMRKVGRSALISVVRPTRSTMILRSSARSWRRLMPHNPEAIQWLLLRARSHEGRVPYRSPLTSAGRTPKGVVAPRTGYDASRLSEQARMRYSSTYQFFSGSKK